MVGPRRHVPTTLAEILRRAPYQNSARMGLICCYALGDVLTRLIYLFMVRVLG